MKLTRTLPACLLAAAALAAGPAQAGLVTWNFSGVVALDTNSPFSVGDTVTGSFSFDNSVAATSSTATTALYNGAIRSFAINGLASLAFDAPGVTINTIEIRDGNGANPSIDRFNAVLRDTLAPQNYFDLTLQRGLAGTNNPPCITSLALPTDPYLPLSCFNTATVTYDYLTAGGTAGSIKLRLTLDDYTRVSEPATLLLLGLGLAGLAAARKRS